MDCAAMLCLTPLSPPESALGVCAHATGTGSCTVTELLAGRSDDLNPITGISKISGKTIGSKINNMITLIITMFLVPKIIILTYYAHFVHQQ